MQNSKGGREGRDATDATVKPHAIAMLIGAIILFLHRHAMAIGRNCFRRGRRRNRHRQRWQRQRKQENSKEQVTKHDGRLASLWPFLNMISHDQIAAGRISIQIAMPIMPIFSVREIKPSGTLLLPPTHAHLSSRLSI
jgi:hypothetical protein